MGQVDLYLAPPGSERDAPCLYAEPLVAEKRGRRKGGDYVGVDGQVRRPGFAAVEAHPGALPPACVPALPPPPAASDADAGGVRVAVRVAVIDVAFGNLGALHGLGSDGAAVDGPFHVGLPEPGAPLPLAALSGAPGHGTAMAGILLHEVPGVRLGLFEIPSAGGAARPYLAATDLATALAAAVEGWRADVVLVAMSDGAWGTPRHLRDVLREAARAGRDGRGAAIFCSVGDPSRNHVRKHDSAALGADDLASQPWVTAVAACDRLGRWYRVYPEYGDGATYNRFGPSVALAASGEPRRFGERIAADDSSQASALAAAAGARVLGANRDLSAVELRALLALTAAVPPDVDGGRGLAAGAHDGRDRAGHSLKLGHGVVDARAACLAAADPICLALLATREAPDAAPADASAGVDAGADADLAPSAARAMAEAWAAAVRREADRPGGSLAREYAGVAGRLARLYLHELPVQEALGWLARHMRALCDADAACAGSWWSPEQDHGALVERIRHAAETTREGLLPGDTDAGGWVRRLEQELQIRVDDGAGAGLFAFLATAFAPVRRSPRSAGAAASLPERSAEDTDRSDDDRRGGRT
jgi:hypothetical protein